MSTDSRRSRRSDKTGSFTSRMWAVIGVLAILAVGGGTVALLQGPRLQSVSVDPEAAIETAGTRLIMTSNQALSEIDPSQVTVEPEAAFTVDAQGRNVGVRFTSPLDDNTTYTVTVAGVTSLGGGTTTSLTTTFNTPEHSIFLLERDGHGGQDAIVRTTLDGKNSEVVFSHEHIEEFRVAPSDLVISVEENGASTIIVTRRDGSDPQRAALPAEGYVMSLQVSNRGSTFGYLFTDRELTDTEGRASILYTGSLRDPSAEPVEMPITGTDPSVGDWMFVPDSEAILLVNYAGDLMLADGGPPTTLGTAYAIDGISRGTYQAMIDRTGEPIEVDLRTGEEKAVTLPPVDGTPGRVEPAADGGQLWQFTQRDAEGMPTGNSVNLVTASGDVRTVLTMPLEDPILQFCVSPSSQYIAATIAPDYANNPYDRYTRPMPRTQTWIVEVATGDVISELDGFDASWCARSQLL